MKKLIVIALIAFAAYWQWSRHPDITEALLSRAQTSFQDLTRTESIGDQVLRNALDNRLSNVLVSGEGEVIRLLPDDNDGVRHQRFIVKLENGQTLRVAHNIDLAARIDALKIGDSIEFRGEYQWNDQGGVLRRTHQDPKGHRDAGWLRHKGRIYQ